MGNKSDTKRRAKLEERRKKADAHLVRADFTQVKVAEWLAAYHAEPNVVAELVDEHGVLLAHVEGNDDDNWTVVVCDDVIAGASDTFAALGLFLAAAADDRAAGNESYMQFAPWLIEEIEARCEAANVGWQDLLRSFPPSEKQQLALPPQRSL